MFSYIRYRWKLRELLKELDNIDRQFQPLIEESRGKSTETQKLISEKAQEEIFVRDLILRHSTDYLFKKASRLIIPVPYDDKFWEESFAIPGTKHLNEDGILQLKKTIREERIARSKSVVVWMSSLTGLIGAATGLLAVLMS